MNQQRGQTKSIRDVKPGQKFRLRSGGVFKMEPNGQHLRLNKPVSKKAMKRIVAEMQNGATLEEAIAKHTRGYRPNELPR